jgi:hypothetical protein
MPKQIITLEYRSYVPHGCIGITFFTLETNDRDLKRKWYNIEYKKYHELRPVIEDMKNKIDQALSDLEHQRSIIKEHKSQYHTQPFIQKLKSFRKYHKRKVQLENEFESKFYTIQNLERDLKKLESEQFYETYTLISLAQDFLNDHGFYIHQKSDDRRYITTEIWYKD